VVLYSSNGDFAVGQPDWLYRRQNILLSAGPIVIGERDECAIFITDAEDVAVRQRLAEWLITPDFATLVQQAVERSLPLIGRVRMDEDKLIALAYNAQVETGNDAIVDDNLIGCISSHVDDILGEQMSLLFTGG